MNPHTPNLDALVQRLQHQLATLAARHADLDCLDASAAPQPGWRVLIGLSGGADSLALLLAARALFGPGAVRALHVDHGLQATSEHCAETVVELCRHLGIDCSVARVTVSSDGNLEQAARDARFAAFAAAMRDAPTILLLAHHQQDSAETVLMRLLRGRSAVDVPAVRKLGHGWLLRPFLEVDRQRLDDVVLESGQRPIEDPSNTDERFDRNWLRLAVMPALRQRIPQLNAILSRQGRRYRAADELLAELVAARALEDAQLLALPRWAAGYILTVARLLSFGEHAAAALRAWLHSAGVHEFSDRQLEELCRQVRDGASGGELNGREVGLRLWRNRLYLEARACLFAPKDTLWPETSLAVADGRLMLSHGQLSWSPERCQTAIRGVDAAATGSLYAAPAGAYDQRVLLPGRSGSRSVSQVLAEAEVPPWRRRGYPLILFQGALVEVAGVGQAQGVAERDSGVKVGSMWRPFVVAEEAF